MPVLHQINSVIKLPNCVAAATAGDTILLMEAAVALVAQPAKLASLPAYLNLKVLQQDLRASGLAPQCPARVSQLSDSQWVAATLEAASVCTW